MKTLIIAVFCTFLFISGCETTPVNPTLQTQTSGDCYIILSDSSRYEAKVESFFFSKGLLFVNRTDSAQLIITPNETTHISKDSSLCQ